MNTGDDVPMSLCVCPLQEVGPQLSSLSWKVIWPASKCREALSYPMIPQNRACVLGLVLDSLVPSTIGGECELQHVAH